MVKKEFFSRYWVFEKKLNYLAVSYVLVCFKNAGLNVEPGQAYQKTDLQKLLRVNQKYMKLLDYILYALEQEGMISLQGDLICFQVPDKVSENIAELNLVMERDFPEYIEILKLVRHCSESYSVILNGEVSGVSIIYPAADINFLKPLVFVIEQLYRVEYQRRILEKIMCRLSKDRKISIIEVGGGTGQMTWRVLPKLNPANVEYLFTDISRFFGVKAKEFAKNQSINFLNIGQFDISKDPEAQGLDLKSFDFILAVNVIHATPNILDTLINLKKILRPNGMIFIMEHVTLPIWANLTWGVLEGWWAFNDNVRSLVPTLEQKDWEFLLQTAGFSNIRAFPKKNKYIDPALSYLGLLASV